MRKIEKYIKNFLDECKLKNYSKNTLKRYEYVLFNHFYEYLIEEAGEKEIEITLNDFNPFLIKGFIYYLKQKKLFPTTIQNDFAIVKAFLRYLYNNIDDFYFDFEKLRNFNVKTPQKVKEGFTKDEIYRIKNEIHKTLEKTKSVNKFSSYLLILLLIETGMRVSEAVNLKKDDIWIEDDFLYGIKIKGKGDKQRINYVKREVFEDYFKKLNAFGIKSGYFFFDKNGSALKYDNLRKINDKILKRLNIKKKGLHLYRHTFATLKLAEGKDISVISQWLGHYNISVTHRFYARANNELMKSFV